ncbi:hypothetical protein [Rhizobium etli]|nr:hypothetical protein [Rhizobium etli]
MPRSKRLRAAGLRHRPQSAAKFSGESERIGTKNFDETGGFGSRTAYV